MQLISAKDSRLVLADGHLAFAVPHEADTPRWRIFRRSTRARGGVLSRAEDEALAVEPLMSLPRNLAKRLVPLRVTCGAKTRKGDPCRAKSELGRRRCRFHGGLSTGPKTAEGRERIADAQRKRWTAWQRRHAGTASLSSSR